MSGIIFNTPTAGMYGTGAGLGGAAAGPIVGGAFLGFEALLNWLGSWSPEELAQWAAHDLAYQEWAAQQPSTHDLGPLPEEGNVPTQLTAEGDPIYTSDVVEFGPRAIELDPLLLPGLGGLIPPGGGAEPPPPADTGPPADTSTPVYVSDVIEFNPRVMDPILPDLRGLTPPRSTPGPVTSPSSRVPPPPRVQPVMPDPPPYISLPPEITTIPPEDFLPHPDPTLPGPPGSTITPGGGTPGPSLTTTGGGGGGGGGGPMPATNYPIVGDNTLIQTLFPLQAYQPTYVPGLGYFLRGGR